MADNFLTRKVGPLPVWGYGALGLGVILILRARAKSTAASTTGASANYSATTPNLPTESLTTPSGFSYSGPAGGGEYYIPQGAMSATAGSQYAPPTGEVFKGGGYSTTPGSYVTAASGSQFAAVPVGAAVGGQKYYYQPEPGVFSAINPAKPPGGPATQWFQLVGSSA